ncbi:hypothetical protein [Lactobacillus psittaci]|uniref:Uncharacterized protein n=1 Tax=Lactobacillus psittaci DSM 15354 TaxID=1122152 RepID=A0A0R1SDF1_9LACO|nr:hypothetical protein [Lactobacillus psittaci]KRL63275.1 hypothetical protein FC23_GL000844 [Lactobacillus psittaci DSM 15354]
MNNLVGKGKEIWSKHKIIVSIVAVILLLWAYNSYQENFGKIDPLDGVDRVAWRIEDGQGYWTYLNSDKAKIATKMRVALLRKMGGQSAISAIEKNSKWYYDDDDYKPIVNAIGQKKTNQLIDELDILKRSIKYDIQSGKLIVSLDIPQSEADKDGIKLEKHEFSTDINKN